MNVLESLHIVSRSAKNRYAWHGRTKLAETLAILKKVGEEHRYGLQMQHIRQRLLEEERDFEDEEKENVDREQGHKELFFVELPGVEFKAGEECLLTLFTFFHENMDHTLISLSYQLLLTAGRINR